MGTNGKSLKRIALVTHDLSQVGGLPSMITFLHRTLTESGRYAPEMISLATSAADASSMRLLAPSTWATPPRIEQVDWHQYQFRHAGVWGSELEPQRYRPRRSLTELYREYDLLQFVVGSPPWVCTAANVQKPIVLWTATTTRADRESQLRAGSIGRKALSSVMVPLAERSERQALQRADRVFALSEYTRESIAAITGRNGVLVAPCGIDTERFHPGAKAGQEYILCVARLWDPRKNVRLLLEAYAQLSHELPGLPALKLVGDPPSADAQELLHDLGIAEKVQLLGPKQGEELARLYREAMFFVLSSNEEGLGIVILEAMASGLPVVSTACGGPATAIAHGDTGFLTKIGDVQELAAAMKRLVEDSSLREAMGLEGRRVAETRFSMKQAGKVFLDSYEELLQGSHSS